MFHWCERVGDAFGLVARVETADADDEVPRTSLDIARERRGDVGGVPDEEMGESVHAALVLRHGHMWSEGLEADLEAFCRERLAGYKRPRSYEVHDALPRSEAGKLTKRELRDPWWAGRDRSI